MTLSVDFTLAGLFAVTLACFYTATVCNLILHNLRHSVRRHVMSFGLLHATSNPFIMAALSRLVHRAGGCKESKALVNRQMNYG